jgi:hypothetical protein
MSDRGPKIGILTCSPLSKRGSVITCGNVEGILVVDQELSLSSHNEKA